MAGVAATAMPCILAFSRAVGSAAHSKTSAFWEAKRMHQMFSARLISCGAHQMGEVWLQDAITEAPPANREDLSGAGSIELFIGPMFAGKTNALLQRIAAHEAAQCQVLTVKSDKDTRYGAAHLHTHDGKSRACYAVSSLSDLKKNWPDAYRDCKVIAIDEGQFFSDLYQFCCTAANDDQKHVVVAGLDGDFRRQKFGQILDLVPQADSVLKLQSRCTYCEAEGLARNALFSLRIAADQRQEVVGGKDIYAAVCRHHYESLSKIRQY